MITVYALKETLRSGSKHYPIYIGLIPAATIAQITNVPRFKSTTSNNDIARNVSSRPVKEWQRPELVHKVAAIRMLYDNTGKFMPNPILLGENISSADRPTVRPYTVAGNATPIWEIQINDDLNQAEKPLWILDGQHRIAGLSSSAQSANPVPVVFLLNQGSNYYQPDTLAEVFAEVTTSATPLGELHKEWLSYAFSLNDYATHQANAINQRLSMATVVELCKTPSFATGLSNSYFDRVRFNDDAPLTAPAHGGWPYDCKELKDIVYRSYYDAQKFQPALTPNELAREMCAAREALAAVLTTALPKSVFFGDEQHHQKIMEDAFWHGVLTYVCHHQKPDSWKDVLRTLKFDQTSWDFSWKVSLHGREQNRSKNLAIRVLGNSFRTSTLEPGIDSLADYLRGNDAGFRIEAYKVKPDGRLDTRTIKVLDVKPGRTVSFPIEDRTAIKINKRHTTANIAEIEVTDKKAAPGTLVKYDLLSRNGLRLNMQQHKQPLELLFTLRHYAGVSSAANIDIVWT